MKKSLDNGKVVSYICNKKTMEFMNVFTGVCLALMTSFYLLGVFAVFVHVKTIEWLICDESDFKWWHYFKSWQYFYEDETNYDGD